MVSSEFYTADNSNLEDKKLEAAKNHYKTGDYQAALRLYLSMLTTNTSYKLYHRIGKCYYKIGDFDNAEEYFGKSAELEKYDNPSFYYLANIKYKKEDLKSAIYYWACAFSSKPEDANISLNLATSYFSRGMRYQSVFYYEKYLKYANQSAENYSAIKNSIDRYTQIGEECLQKAKLALERKDNKTALEFLMFAVKNSPVDFNINYLLGCSYLEENDNMHALIYLKQAYCLDPKSLDVIQRLASVYINLGDYTSAYCMMRRLLPLVIHNQEEYLKTMQVIKSLDSTFDELSYTGHKEWGDKYFDDNNYHFALFEYENCTILKEDMQQKLSDKIYQLKSFLNPESRIIRTSIELGGKAYKDKDYKTSNKYFTKVLKLSSPDTSEYKLAKSRVVDV